MIQGTLSRKFDNLDSVFIEITTHCNMHCRFCPSDCLVRPKMMMDYHNVIKILHELSELHQDTFLDIGFHLLGEPLLNPFLMEYLSLCDEYGFKVTLVTNLLLLDDAMLDKVFSHPCVWHLYVSYYAISKDAYALRGSKMPYDNYWKLLKGLIFHEKRIASPVCVEVYVMNDSGKALSFSDKLWNTFDETSFVAFLDIFDQWADELKVAHPALRRVNEMSIEEIIAARDNNPLLFSLTNPGTFCDRGIADRSECCDYLAPDWDKYFLFTNLVISLKSFWPWTSHQTLLEQIFMPNKYRITHLYPHGKFGCATGTKQLVVLSNGDITFCCQDYEGEMAIGNIDNMSLIDAASSPIRAFYKDNADLFKTCRRCKSTLIVESMDNSPDSALYLFNEIKALKIMKSGWSGIEPWGTWSNGEKSIVRISVSPETRVLRLKGIAYTHHNRPQNIHISINNYHICHIKITDHNWDVRVDLSKEILDDIAVKKPLNIEFYLPDAVSPKSLHLSPDERMLAIGLNEIHVLE